MLYPQISSDWCVGWTWFDVRCIPLILENVLHTHNMVFRPTENFLAASEGPTFVKISTFYHVFGASTPPSRVSIKYQKRSSLRFLLQKIISGYHTGSKITFVYSLDLREHEHGYFRSPGRGGENRKIAWPLFSIGRTNMRRRAFDRFMFQDYQTIFLWWLDYFSIL